MCVCVCDILNLHSNGKKKSGFYRLVPMVTGRIVVVYKVCYANNMGY